MNYSDSHKEHQRRLAALRAAIQRGEIDPTEHSRVWQMRDCTGTVLGDYTEDHKQRTKLPEGGYWTHIRDAPMSYEQWINFQLQEDCDPVIGMGWRVGQSYMNRCRPNEANPSIFYEENGAAAWRKIWALEDYEEQVSAEKDEACANALNALEDKSDD